MVRASPCADKLFDVLGCRGLASVSASGPSEFLSSSQAGERQAQANTRSHMCYSPGVSQNVSIRDLRNDASAVVRRVEAGETLVVTVDRRIARRAARLRGLQGLKLADAIIVATATETACEAPAKPIRAA